MNKIMGVDMSIPDQWVRPQKIQYIRLSDFFFVDRLTRGWNDELEPTQACAASCVDFWLFTFRMTRCGIVWGLDSRELVASCRQHTSMGLHISVRGI